MNDNGSFEANSQPIYDIMSLDSNGNMQFDYSYSHDSIEQDTSYSSSLESTEIETKDVKIDFTKTVPLLQNLEFFEDKVLEMKYLHKLDSLSRSSGYHIAPIRKKSSAKKAALLNKESQIDVPKKEKHLKVSNGSHESKVILSSHQLSGYGQYGRNYEACDPNCNDRLKAQLAIIRRKEEEKAQALERQKNKYSKRGVFGEFCDNAMPED